MNFRHLAFIVSLSTCATGNVDANLCVDSVLKFRETTNGQNQICTAPELTCADSPTVRSHCKAKCDNYYCCEDSKSPYLEVQPPKGKPIVWKPCAKLKKYCSKVSDVASACPVTCKKCVPHSISDIVQMIDLNAASNKDAFEEQEAIISEQGATISEQGATISEQGATISEQGSTISEQGAIISEQETTITDLKEGVRDLESRYRFGDYEYAFASELKLWADHNRTAHEWGGHLASCHSNEESIFMMSLVRNTRAWMYIDGVRSAYGETMYNTDGTAFDYLNWWGPTEPHGDIYTVMLPYKAPDNHDQDGMPIADIPVEFRLPAIYKREFKYL